MAISSLSATTPHDVTPMHGTSTEDSCSIRPTISITPALVPPVMIHALVVRAADSSPRRKTSFCLSVMLRDPAPPVTEMRADGGGSCQMDCSPHTSSRRALVAAISSAFPSSWPSGDDCAGGIAVRCASFSRSSCAENLG